MGTKLTWYLIRNTRTQNIVGVCSDDGGVLPELSP